MDGVFKCENWDTASCVSNSFSDSCSDFASVAGSTVNAHYTWDTDKLQRKVYLDTLSLETLQAIVEDEKLSTHHKNSSKQRLDSQLSGILVPEPQFRTDYAAIKHRLVAIYRTNRESTPSAELVKAYFSCKLVTVPTRQLVVVKFYLRKDAALRSMNNCLKQLDDELHCRIVRRVKIKFLNDKKNGDVNPSTSSQSSKATPTSSSQNTKAIHASSSSSSQNKKVTDNSQNNDLAKLSSKDKTDIIKLHLNSMPNTSVKIAADKLQHPNYVSKLHVVTLLRVIYDDAYSGAVKVASLKRLSLLVDFFQCRMTEPVYGAAFREKLKFFKNKAFKNLSADVIQQLKEKPYNILELGTLSLPHLLCIIDDLKQVEPDRFKLLKEMKTNRIPRIIVVEYVYLEAAVNHLTAAVESLREYNPATTTTGKEFLPRGLVVSDPTTRSIVIARLASVDAACTDNLLFDGQYSRSEFRQACYRRVLDAYKIRAKRREWDEFVFDIVRTIVRESETASGSSLPQQPSDPKSSPKDAPKPKDSPKPKNKNKKSAERVSSPSPPPPFELVVDRSLNAAQLKTILTAKNKEPLEVLLKLYKKNCDSKAVIKSIRTDIIAKIPTLPLLSSSSLEFYEKSKFVQVSIRDLFAAIGHSNYLKANFKLDDVKNTMKEQKKRCAPFSELDIRLPYIVLLNHIIIEERYQKSVNAKSKSEQSCKSKAQPVATANPSPPLPPPPQTPPPMKRWDSKDLIDDIYMRDVPFHELCTIAECATLPRQQKYFSITYSNRIITKYAVEMGAEFEKLTLLTRGFVVSNNRSPPAPLPSLDSIKDVLQVTPLNVLIAVYADKRATGDAGSDAHQLECVNLEIDTRIQRMVVADHLEKLTSYLLDADHVASMTIQSLIDVSESREISAAQKLLVSDRLNDLFNVCKKEMGAEFDCEVERLRLEIGAKTSGEDVTFEELMCYERCDYARLDWGQMIAVKRHADLQADVTGDLQKRIFVGKELDKRISRRIVIEHMESERGDGESDVREKLSSWVTSNLARKPLAEVGDDDRIDLQTYVKDTMIIELVDRHHVKPNSDNFFNRCVEIFQSISFGYSTNSSLLYRFVKECLHELIANYGRKDDTIHKDFQPPNANAKPSNDSPRLEDKLYDAEHVKALSFDRLCAIAESPYISRKTLALVELDSRIAATISTQSDAYGKVYEASLASVLADERAAINVAVGSIDDLELGDLVTLKRSAEVVKELELRVRRRTVADLTRELAGQQLFLAVFSMDVVVAGLQSDSSTTPPQHAHLWRLLTATTTGAHSYSRWAAYLKSKRRHFDSATSSKSDLHDLVRETFASLITRCEYAAAIGDHSIADDRKEVATLELLTDRILRAVKNNEFKMDVGLLTSPVDHLNTGITDKVLKYENPTDFKMYKLAYEEVHDLYTTEKVFSDDLQRRVTCYSNSIKIIKCALSHKNELMMNLDELCQLTDLVTDFSRKNAYLREALRSALELHTKDETQSVMEFLKQQSKLKIDKLDILNH